jgi:hypothetical protein
MQHKAAPPYGWLTGLAVYLNENAGRGNWAFTGSFAMYCWAWMKDGQARDPEDIDILVSAARFENVAYGINGKFKKPGENFSPPNPRSRMATVQGILHVGSGTPEVIQAREVKIDILNVLAGDFGNLEKVVFLSDNDRFPVLPIGDLIARKENILTSTGKKEEILKAKQDIAFLKGLM